MRYLFHGGRHAQPRDEANSGFRVAVSALVCYPQKPPVRCMGHCVRVTIAMRCMASGFLDLLKRSEVLRSIAGRSQVMPRQTAD